LFLCFLYLSISDCLLIFLYSIFIEDINQFLKMLIKSNKGYSNIPPLQNML
jgi:hypothetical protein